MEDRALADRLVNYADALAAVSFVGMSGLSIAVADPDVRCSITQGALVPVGLINLVSASLVTVILAILRRWERDLRTGSPGVSSVYVVRHGVEGELRAPSA
jgi:hypothetical protein